MPDVAPVSAIPSRRRLTLEIRQQVSLQREAAVLAIALLVGLTVAASVLVAFGVPAESLATEFAQTFFDQQNIHAVLVQAAPMILIGLAASPAFRIRFWNLGLEGQMIWGAIAATAISFYAIGPEDLRLPIMFSSAGIAGLLWEIGRAHV